MEERTINRVLSVFDKATDWMVDKHDITISHKQLSKIITPRPGDSYFILEYDIDQRSADLLRPYTEVIFDFGKYLYQIGTYKPLVDGKYVP